MNINEINKELLKEKLRELLETVKNQDKEEIFLESINELFIEEWLDDEEKDVLVTNVFSSALIASLRNRIKKEIGNKYVTSSSKLSTLVSAFLDVEIVEKTYESIKEEIETNEDVLKGIKEIVRHFDEEEGENW